MQIHQKHNFAGGGDQFCEVCVEKHLTPARRQRLQQTVKQCHVRAQLYCQPCVLYPSTDHTKAWTQGILCKPRLHSLLKPEMPDSPASISLRVAVHETTAYNHIPALGQQLTPAPVPSTSMASCWHTSSLTGKWNQLGTTTPGTGLAVVTPAFLRCLLCKVSPYISVVLFRRIKQKTINVKWWGGLTQHRIRNLWLSGDTTAWNDSTGEGHRSPPLAQVHNKVVEQRLQLKWHAAWNIFGLIEPSVIFFQFTSFLLIISNQHTH